jgi:hypothetical protein
MRKPVAFMDLQACCDFFDRNVGHRVFLKIRESLTNKIRKIEGVIETSFNHDPSPVSTIKTKRTVREIFLGEVVSVEVVS